MTALTANTSATANDMALEILGPGFTINTATYSGDSAASGIYSNGDTTNPNVLPSDTGVILSTGTVANFGNAGGANNQSGGRSTDTAGVDGDSDFNTAAGGATFDASFLVINFTPEPGQTSLNIEFRFYSEEYNEYVYSNFNDIALVMLDGIEQQLSVGTGEISVNSINNAAATPPTFGSQANDPNPGNGVWDSSSPNLYIDNTSGTFDTEMDGFTVTLSLDIPVTPGVAQTLKIGVADKGDTAWDSALVIASNQQTSGTDTDPIATDDSTQLYGSVPKTYDLLANDTDPNGQTLTITEINGVPVVSGSTVTLPNGDTVTLNPSGTITLVNASGSSGTSSSFSYTVSDTDGNTDSAFVTYGTNAPCFTPGTLINTPHGTRKIEDLMPGDLILTRDMGPQPLRWVGRKTIVFNGDGTGDHLRPILIRKGALGPNYPRRDTLVSPQHRFLLCHHRVPLYIGVEEALASARHLVDGEAARVDTACHKVTYIHLLFDTHQIITANGAPTESLYPGDQALGSFAPRARDELFEIFPELRSMPGRYGNTARTVLKRFEAQLCQVA